MPRNSSGVYSSPPGVTAVPGTTIESTPYNTNLSDVASTFTDSLSRSGQGGMLADLAMGGFKISGMATPTLSNDAVTKAYADALVSAGGAFPAEITVASATTTDILGAASDFIAISGTTTITSLGTGINRLRLVRFTGVLTLTHNATSLILPGAANITTAAGDVMLLTSDASSNVRIWSYVPAASATTLGLPAQTVASAATCDILGANTPLVTISGTTTITSLGTGANRVRFVTFTGLPAFTATISIATPAVVTAANSFVAGQPVVFSTTGALPTGLSVGVTYYVIAAGLTGSAFEVSATVGGSAINTSGTQSGTHTVIPATLLTYNATTLILPGTANISAYAGDTCIVTSDASSNARVVSYRRASGVTAGAYSYASLAVDSMGNISAISSGATPKVDYQLFTASGTWTKPSNALSTSVTMVIGWGAGGGGGTNATGGGGGGGANPPPQWFPTIDGNPKTVTISIATPAVVSYSNTFVAGQTIQFQTTGALPTGITAGNNYYVIATGLTTSQFQFSTTVGGSAVNTSGSQSGTHTITTGLGATETVTVGTGAIGTAGGNSSFGNWLVAYGGGAASSSAAGGGGGGGGQTGAGANAVTGSGGAGGGILAGAGGTSPSTAPTDGTFGGGGGGYGASTAVGGASSAYGGGGGGGGTSSTGPTGGNGGSAIWGGGGGAGLGTSGTGTAGASQYSGAGGTAGVAGTAPSGGGGRNAAGGRGQVLVVTFI